MQAEREDLSQRSSQSMDIEQAFHSIDKLEEHGIAAADIKKLIDAGFNTVNSLRLTSMKHLQNIKGITEPKMLKIMDAVKKIMPLEFELASSVYDKRMNIVRITTGSKAFDQVLGGGVEQCSITEVYGEFRSGKSQLCHTMAVTAQLAKKQNGGEGKVIYIDTEGTFRPERIVQIAEKYGLDGRQVLDNISIARAHNVDHQTALLMNAAALMCADKYSLLIYDSATHHFRTEYQGRGELSVRQNHLGVFLRNLQKLADEFKVAVVITNQVMATPDAMAFGDKKLPVGGNILAHACTTRVYMRKGKGNNRICKVVDSPMMPEAEAEVEITQGGIEDPSS